MPGIFDVLSMQGILNQLLGGGNKPLPTNAIDTGDDTQRMLNRQRAILSGEGSVTNPPSPSFQDAGGEMGYPNAAMPMIAQAMQQGQAGFAPMSSGTEMAYPNDMSMSAPQSAPAAAQDNSPESNPLFKIGRALTIAGSRDPGATYQQLMDINKPKVTPLAGGAFSLITKPDGTQQIVKNAEIAQYLSDQSDMKRLFEFMKIDRRSEAEVKAAGQKEAQKEQVKSAGDSTSTSNAVSELNSIADSLLKTDSATGPAIGLLPKFARDIVTPAGADLQDRAERIIQASLRQTLGAQFTEKEGARFLERAYNPRLDEKTNAERLRRVGEELSSIQENKDAALEYMKKNGTLDGFKPAAAAPKSSSDLSTQAKSAFGSYEPDLYEYRMNNGVLQRRKK